jgi:hypothetical protein
MESHRSSIQKEMGVGVRSSRTVLGDGVVHWVELLPPGIALVLAGDPGPLSIHGHRRSDVKSSQPGTYQGDIIDLRKQYEETRLRRLCI